MAETEGGVFTIRVDFLTRPALTDTTARGRGVEWPPHPHRLFAAITAAHYEAGAGRRETLEWLERQAPPEISAPEIHERTTGTVYVPVNDPILKTPDVIEQGFPDRPLGDRRRRQERTFSIGSPLPPRDESGQSRDYRSVYYTWRGPEAPPEDLDDILREVTRLGHSSSLVAASLWASDPPPPSLIPASGGELELRIPEPGTLARLDELHEIRTLPTREQDRRMPSLGPDRWTGYRRADRSAPDRGPWSEHWIWTLEPRISVTAWIHLAEAIRGTLLHSLPQDAAGVLNGHGQGNHLAVVPLPHVGHPHADGSVLGFAVLAPELDEDVRDTLLLALGQLTEIGQRGQIRAGAAGLFRAEGAKSYELRRTLRSETWTGPARAWATVTPLVFDRFPKGNLPLEQIAAASVRRLGLPAPAEVHLCPEAVPSGAPPSHSFRVRRSQSAARRRRDRRPWSHALLRWDRPVEGPVVLGAMRHFGLGLCKPVSLEELGSVGSRGNDSQGASR